MSTTAQAAPAGAAEHGARSAPRAVTRGVEKQAAKIDWLHATFPEPEISPEGFVGLLAAMLGRPVSAMKGQGMFGFTGTLRLAAHIGSRTAHMGTIAMGGDAQNGRWLLQLTGGGCGLVDDWPAFEGLLEDLGATITRVDLAVDFLDGEWTVDDAVDVYTCGGFAFDGKTQPKHRLAGDWLGGDDGRTLYVGRSQNGKMLRVYEKGKELGDPHSDWCRFEVQLGNRDRVIPLDVLTHPDRYFAGAYPALADLLEQGEATSIRVAKKGGLLTLAHALHHLKRSYGKWLDAACESTKVTHAELVEEVRVIGIPRRLQPSCSAARLTWAQLLAQLRRKAP